MIATLLLGFAAAPALQEPPPAPKKAFARLTTLQQKAVQEDLVALRRAEKEEDRAAARQRLTAAGEGIVPLVLDATKQYVEAGRMGEIETLLRAALTDPDLHLAWTHLKKSAPEPIRAHLTRRYADSAREDATGFLRPLLKDAMPSVAYEAARGLVRRGDREGLPPVQEAMRARWTQEAARLRADFAGVERGPLADVSHPFLSSTKIQDRLLGLRLFELFGVREHARLLLPALSESDTTLRLAAIDACRVVIGGEPPLDKPSMTQIIEHAEAWKKKL